MNKIYKVIWSKTRNCYVVVSEMAKHCAKSSGVASSRTKTARVLGAVLLCACLAGGYNIQAAHAEDEIKEAGVAGSNVTRAGYSNASAWGNATTAEGTNSTAWGIKTRAKGQNTTAWGNETVAEGANATAWGLKSQAIGTNSTAFGNSSIANGMNSLAALGGITAAGASGSIAIGLESSASGMHSVAIGLEAKADLAHSVAMGGYSVANRAAGVTGYNPSGSAVNGNAWVATQSAVSVGASATDSDTATVTRQITGVAAGTFDTDAVNVAQLKSAMQNAGSGQTYTAGDGIVIDKESNKISVKSSNIVPDADGFAKAAAVYMEVRPHSDGAYIKKEYSTGQNLAILDEQVRQTGGALKEEIKNRTTAVSEEAAARISEDAALSNRIGSLSANGQYIKAANDVAANLAALDTNLATGLRREAADRNASIENTSRALEAADTALSNRIGSLSANGQYIKTTNNVAANLAVLDSNLATGLRREAADRNASIDNVSRALAAADTALTERIDTEAKDRADADAVLSQLIDTEHSERLSENATLGNQISTEVSERKTADATLGSRISTETSERKAEDANLGKRIDTEISERKTAVTNLGNRISTETSERKAEDATLGSRISTEVSERKTADTNLGKRIDSEITERTAADTALSNRIGSLSANGNYIAKSDSISKNLTALDTQLKNTVTGLQTETAERKTAVSNEVYARESADTALSNRIGSLSKDGNYIRKNYDVAYNMTLLDSQMKAADTAIQALANVDIATIEVMAEYVDVVVENKRNIQTNTGDIINLNKKTTDLETALNRETTNRTSADNTLDSKIQQEVSDRTAANRALEADINKEATDRAAADTALGNRIDTETSERKSADTALGNRIDTETSERKSADTALGKRIDTETSERKSADTALGNRIDQEAAERTAADKALESLIAKEAAARGETELVMAALIDEEAADREAGDTALGARIDKEASDRDSADKALGARIDKEASDRDLADKALGARIDKEASDRDAADKALGSRIDKEASNRAAADTALSGRIGTLAGDGSVIRKDSNVSENLAMLDQALQEQAAMDEEILENKANADASNVGRNAIVKDNSADWGAALGTGAVQSKNGKLVTGDTVYNEVRAGSDGAYIKAANTAAANLTALDEQMSANTDAIDQNREDIAANAADIAKNRDAIAANAADIAANAADIAENRDAIATNAAGIATNTKKIAAVKTTADTALSGVSVLLIGTGLNIDEIVATDQKVNELAKNEAVIANRDYVETVEQEDGTTKEVAKSREFVRGYTVYEYLNGKPGEENAAMTLGQNAERIAVGKGATVTGERSISLGTTDADGNGNEVSGKQSIAIGSGLKVYGSNSGAIGDPMVVAADQSYVVGNNNKIGNRDYKDGEEITENNIFVMGNNNTVSGSNTFVLGNNVDTDATNAVVLGHDSEGVEGAVSVGSSKPGGQRQIKNVADGTDATDAATVGQLQAVSQNAYNNAVYLNNSINRLDSKVNKVGAGAAALAALHPVEMDNKFGMGLGYGNYRDAHSMAVGLFYRPKDNLMFSIGGSMGNGENMFNAGISIALDKGFTSSKAVMARKIAAQDTIIATQGAELEAQKKENEQQKAEIQALKEALARLEAKIGK